MEGTAPVDPEEVRHNSPSADIPAAYQLAGKGDGSQTCHREEEGEDPGKSHQNRDQGASILMASWGPSNWLEAQSWDRDEQQKD